MASTLSASWTLANDATFQQRVTMAVLRHAAAVKQTIAVDPVKRNEQRKAHALADRVIADPESYGVKVAFVFASLANVEAGITDNALMLAMATAWPQLAGVQPGEVD